MDLDSIELRPLKHDSVELRLVGSRTLTTRSGREVHESTAFEAYWLPAGVAQGIIKANRFADQAGLFADYLRTIPEDGYWIASADEDDEAVLLSSYNRQIKDQHISKIVRRGEENYSEIQETTRYYIGEPDPYSYLFVADLPEADIFWRLVDKLIDDEYLPSLQVCATMTPSITPETSIG